MKFPIRIQFRNVEKSNSAYNEIWDCAERLETFCDRVTSCEVVVSAPHQSKKTGFIYHVHIHLHIPGKEIFVGNEPEKNGAHENLHVAIRDAFAAIERKLDDLGHIERGEIKTRTNLPHGKIARLFPDEKFGFITTPDQREIYFHAHSLLNDDFENLIVGDEVRFSEEMGEKGPQVSSMSRVGVSGHMVTSFYT